MVRRKKYRKQKQHTRKYRSGRKSTVNPGIKYPITVIAVPRNMTTKKFLKSDFDLDGVMNQKDCRPFDPFRQDDDGEMSEAQKKALMESLMGDPEIQKSAEILKDIDEKAEKAEDEEQMKRELDPSYREAKETEEKEIEEAEWMHWTDVQKDIAEKRSERFKEEVEERERSRKFQEGRPGRAFKTEFSKVVGEGVGRAVIGPIRQKRMTVKADKQRRKLEKDAARRQARADRDYIWSQYDRRLINRREAWRRVDEVDAILRRKLTALGR